MSAIDLAGRLITLEGLDFTGKSTIARRLETHLKEHGQDIVMTREPGGTRVGELIRQLLLSPQYAEMLPFSELLLFMVSRAQHYREIIRPALDRGQTVLTSRYRLSSMAYQGYGRRIDLDLIRRLNDAATEGREADITFLIDLPVETALGRKRGAGDRIEAEDTAFYERVRSGYLELVSGDDRVHVIDGTQTAEGVFRDVADRLDLSF